MIDYDAEDFTKAVADCDVVFDTVGGDIPISLRRAEARRPSVWIAAAPEGSAARSDVKVLRPGVARDRKHLERMLEPLDADAVWPPTIVRFSSPTRPKRTG